MKLHRNDNEILYNYLIWEGLVGLHERGEARNLLLFLLRLPRHALCLSTKGLFVS